MKKLFALIAPVTLLITGSQIGYAQSKTTNKLLPPPAHMAVDGDLREWGDQGNRF